MKEELNYTDIINVKTPTEYIPQDATIVVPASNFLCKVNNTIFLISLLTSLIEQIIRLLFVDLGYRVQNL